MLQMTKTVIEAALKSDPTVTPTQLRAVFATLEGKTAVALTDPEPLDEALSRNEVAKILNICPRTVSVYAKRGLIRPFRGGTKRMRATGYSRRSVKEYQMTASDSTQTIKG